MSFASTAWDKQESLNLYLNASKDQTTSLVYLVKSLSAAEDEYARSLLKIAKTYKDSIAKNNDKNLKAGILSKSGVRESYEALVKSLEVKANSHTELADQLGLARKALKETGKAVDVRNDQSWERIRASVSEVQKLISVMESKNGAYYKDLAHIETTSGNLRKYLKEKKDKDAEKAKLELDKLLNQVHHSNLQFQDSIKIANMAKMNHFQVNLPKLLDEIQKDDEELRIFGMKDTLLNVSEAYLKTIPLASELWTGHKNNSIQIDKAVESSEISATLKTDNAFPADFEFTDTNIEFHTKKGMFKPGNENDGMEDLAKIEDYQKKGKKIIAEKIKAVELDIIEIAKRQQLYDTISSMSSASRDLSSFNAQREELHAKMNSLLLKNHKYHVYVAHQEGKPIPNPPGLKGLSTGVSPLSDVQAPSTEEPSSLHSSDTKGQSEMQRLENVFNGQESPMTEIKTESSDVQQSPKSTPKHSRQISDAKKPRMTLQQVSALAGSPVKKIGRSVDKLDSPDSISDASHRPVSLAQPRIEHKMPVIKAIYDFEAANDAEVNLSIDDVLDLIEERTDGWSQVRTRSGKEGLVPTAYTAKSEA